MSFLREAFPWPSKLQGWGLLPVLGRPGLGCAWEAPSPSSTLGAQAQPQKGQRRSEKDSWSQHHGGVTETCLRFPYVSVGGEE